MIGKQLCCFIVKLSRICLAALQKSEKKRILQMIHCYQLRSQEDARLRELGIQETKELPKLTVTSWHDITCKIISGVFQSCETNSVAKSRG